MFQLRFPSHNEQLISAILGRVVGGTLMRNPQSSYNGAPYGYQTMMATGKGMRYNGMTMGPQNTMMASQPNFGAQGMMQGEYFL